MEYEQLQTLMTVRGLGHVGWDAMGEFLLVEARVGKPEGPLKTIRVTLTAETAAALQALLLLCLREKEDEAGPMQ